MVVVERVDADAVVRTQRKVGFLVSCRAFGVDVVTREIGVASHDGAAGDVTEKLVAREAGDAQHVGSVVRHEYRAVADAGGGTLRHEADLREPPCGNALLGAVLSGNTAAFEIPVPRSQTSLVDRDILLRDGGDHPDEHGIFAGPFVGGFEVTPFAGLFVEFQQVDVERGVAVPEKGVLELFGLRADELFDIDVGLSFRMVEVGRLSRCAVHFQRIVPAAASTRDAFFDRFVLVVFLLGEITQHGTFAA